jgi:GWxTD domain-containing protein
MCRIVRPRVLIAVMAVFSLASIAQTNQWSQLSPEYKRWLNEDARWIITSHERKQFMDFASDRDRGQFVTAFWERRNPTTGSQNNAFKEEHYRRLAFANEHFAPTVAGWETDRGREFTSFTGHSTQFQRTHPLQPTRRMKSGFITISKTAGRRCSCDLSTAVIAATTTSKPTYRMIDGSS